MSWQPKHKPRPSPPDNYTLALHRSSHLLQRPKIWEITKKQWDSMERRLRFTRWIKTQMLRGIGWRASSNGALIARFAAFNSTATKIDKYTRLVVL
ncbi:hypothetical protein HAX54_008502 [Datura stramonium]|uniref:Uncharacterized protein n=1 Tax=Datura stramonium TaxID=4076 RepID=A0ABS8TDC2_DATST|nr:hypothetical protein [Datura stramonium]